MKKILNIFFIVLGVMFCIMIVIGAYFFVADPFNIKPLLFSEQAKTTDGTTQDAHPFLSESQQKALKTFGIDPSSVPSDITPEQEACFEAKLGAERVAEIKAGDSPTVTEYFKARDCI